MLRRYPWRPLKSSGLVKYKTPWHGCQGFSPEYKWKSLKTVKGRYNSKPSQTSRMQHEQSTFLMKSCSKTFINLIIVDSLLQWTLVNLLPLQWTKLSIQQAKQKFCKKKLVIKPKSFQDFGSSTIENLQGEKKRNLNFLKVPN